MERFFGTLAAQFSKACATYCGSDPATKPEDLPAKLARGAAPTLADLRGASRQRWKPFGPFLLEVERIYTAQLIEIEAAHVLAARTAEYVSWSVPMLRDTQKYVKRYILPGLTAERGGAFDGGSSRASNDI